MVQTTEDTLPQGTRRNFLKVSIPLEQGDKCKATRAFSTKVERALTGHDLRRSAVARYMILFDDVRP